MSTGITQDDARPLDTSVSQDADSSEADSTQDTTGAEASAVASDSEHLSGAKLVQGVADLRDRLTLTDVRTQRLAAEVTADPPLSVTSIRVTVADPEVLLDATQLAVRLTQRVVLLDEQDQTLAYVEVALIVEFVLADGERPSEQVIALYVEHNAYFIAHPYLREAVQSTTSRLGLDPVVLGTLSRHEERPSDVTLVPRRTG